MPRGTGGTGAFVEGLETRPKTVTARESSYLAMRS